MVLLFPLIRKRLYVSTSDNMSNGDISKSYKGDKPKMSGKLLANDLSGRRCSYIQGRISGFWRVYLEMV